jgi:hypothetical protein
MLDDLTALFEQHVPPPIFASSVIFPSDGAWHFTEGKQEFICAGPLFWQNLPAEYREVLAPGHSMTLSGIEIIDVDAPGNSPKRELVMSALAKAIEARRAETGTGSVHESAVSEGNSPEPIRPSGKGE